MSRHELATTPLPWVQRNEPAKPEEIGPVLNRFWPHFCFLADKLLPQKLQSKADPDDLVQQAFTEAIRTFTQFTGTTQEDLRAWVRGILRHKLSKFGKRFQTSKRNVEREQSFENLRSEGCPMPRSREPAPEARMLYQEEIGAPLASAILVLKYLAPGPPARVFTLHHEEECSLAAIANLLGSSKSAVHRLWQEAIADLKYLVLVLSRQLA